MKDRLIQLRKKLNLTQEEFGKEVNLTDSMISILESGKKTPKEGTIRLICITFGVNETWLRNGIGDMFKEPPKMPENAKEQQLLDLFRRLVPEMQDIVLKKVKKLLETIEESWNPPPVEDEKGEQKGA